MAKLTNKQRSEEFNQMITDALIKQIESGKTSWLKMWKSSSLQQQHNPITGTKYRGVNVFWLMLVSEIKGYSDSRWGTYNNIKKIGGQVTKGERGTKVLIWRPVYKKVNGKYTDQIEYLVNRYWTIFNYSQCDGIEAQAPQEPEFTNGLNEVAQAYIEGEEIEILMGGDRACYSPMLDKIRMPNQSTFKSETSFVSTLFHEIAHSTGAKNRLNREGVTNSISFGNHDYSLEELVAEMTAVMMTVKVGPMEIGDKCFNNSAAYMKHWISHLKDNPDWIATATREASKAVELITSHTKAAKAAKPVESAA